MWSFINPIYLWAASAALIPLMLHLMQKRRIITIPFSSIRFLQLAHKRSANRIRLENFLLWLLRTLMLLGLALGFAMPVLRISSFSQLLGGSQRDVAIVWDASYSMAYTSGNKNIWASSKETILAILEGLQAGDRVSIFLADDDVTALIEQPSTDLAAAMALVKAQEVKNTSSRLGPALQAASHALRESPMREQEIHIISDGQRLPWQDLGKQAPPASASHNPSAAAPLRGAEPAPTATRSTNLWNHAPQIMFFVTSLGVSAPENSAPLMVATQPDLVIAESAAKLKVQLMHSGPAQNITATLILGEEELERRALTIEQDSGAELIFNLPPLPAGVYPARIETPPDGLALDNAFYFLLRSHQQLPVLCLGSEDDLFFLMHALNPWSGPGAPAGAQSAALAARRVEMAALNDAQTLTDAACVILCNAVPISGPALLALEQYVHAGGLLVLFPGDRGQPVDYENWTCLPARPQSIADLPSGQKRTLRLLKPGDPLFTGLKLPPGTVPNFSIKRELLWQPLAAQSEIVIVADEDHPFLLRRTFGRGRVFCFAVSADRRWSSFPLSPFFLPLIHQIVLHGAQVQQEQSFIWTGRDVRLDAIQQTWPAQAELRGPAGEKIVRHTIKSGSQTMMSAEAINQPGIYYLQRPGHKDEPFMAVNVPRMESDLARLNPREIPALLNSKQVKLAESKDDLLQLIKEHRVGRPLGEQFLWLAFILGMLEVILANYASRQGSSLSRMLQVEDSGRVKGTLSS